MVPTIGHVSVVVALATSLYAAGAFLASTRRADERLLDSARHAVYATFALAAVASLAMMISLLTHDFSVSYVARHNSTTTPPFYSVISLWAALEGSILFWVLLLTGYAAVALHRLRKTQRQLLPWAGATLAIIGAFFFGVIAVPGNPFARVTPVALEGPGPNALLQNHPFMGLHPPLLYLGYVGLSVPFAFCVAALITRRTDDSWLAAVRRWTLIPWIFLSMGIVAGAWWSYEVLGWGGYWAWDPVENAALLPWLTATAFIHSSMVAERRGALRIWNVALIIATFQLTLLGTFLTRSGVVASVHSFTQSLIGPIFAVAIAVSVIGSLALLLWRLPSLRDDGPGSAAVSRESAFLFNNVLFLGLTFAVLFGTLLPLAVEAAGGGKISVGAPWFNRVGLPLMLALLFLMGVGPALPWGAASLRTLRDRFRLPLGMAALTAIVGLLLRIDSVPALVTLSLTAFSATVMIEEFVRGTRSRGRRRDEAPPVAAWRLATRNRRRYGGYAVHLGVLVMAVAIAISSTLATDTTVTLRAGERVELAGYTVTFDRLVVEPLAANPAVTEARAEVTYGGRSAGTLAPALRDYPNSEQLIATPAVHTTVGEDLYLTLLAYDPAAQEIGLHVFVNPLVAWIWIGGAIVALGAVFAAWPDRRLRNAVRAVGSAQTPAELAVPPMRRPAVRTSAPPLIDAAIEREGA